MLKNLEWQTFRIDTVLGQCDEGDEDDEDDEEDLTDVTLVSDDTYCRLD